MLVASCRSACGHCCVFVRGRCVVGAILVLGLISVFAEDGHATWDVGVVGICVDGSLCFFSWSFCFRRDGVIVFWYELVLIAYCLEEDVDAVCRLYMPEDFPMLEPSMCKDAIDSTEDIRELSH